MPYGQGQMLGAGVDPRMFVQDYSGFTRAAEIQAQGMQNLGAMIGKGIADFGEARKERKKIDAEIKATSAGIESAIKMGKDLGIDIESYLAPVQAKINDPNTSPVEALALGRTAAQGISNAFTLGIGAQDRAIKQNQLRSENAFRLANLEVAQQRANIYGQKAQAEAFKRTEGEISILDPDTGKERKERVWKDQFGNSYDYDTKRPIINTEKYFYGEEGGLGELPPTSQIAPSGQINQSALSSPLRQYAQSFEEYGNKYGVDPALLAAIAEHETGGGKSSAFRNKNNAMGVSNASGPIKMASVEASIEKMASLLGRGMNEGKGPYANAKSIEDIGRKYAPIGAGNDPGNLNKFWTRGVSSKYEKLATPKQIDEAISMGDDGSQQAMGTPEQQAEVGRMIEQSAGMRTAQAAPSGAMPTEPRINQQPQPAPRRMVRGIPVGGGATSSKFRPANAEEVSMYGTQGQVNVETGEFKPIRPPSGVSLRQLPGGGFEFVQGAGAADRFTKAAEEAKKQAVQSADRNIQDLMEAKRLYASVMQSKGVIPAAARKLESITPGTELHTIQEGLLKDFKSRLGLEQLTQLRMASPTGAAVGNPTNAEGLRLESVFGSLDPTSSPAIFNRNINRAIESYLDVIHGTPEQRDKLMEEGKITAKQNAEIEAQYPSSTMDTMGIEQPRQTGGTGNPAIDEIIKRNNIPIK